MDGRITEFDKQGHKEISFVAPDHHFAMKFNGVPVEIYPATLHQGVEARVAGERFTSGQFTPEIQLCADAAKEFFEQEVAARRKMWREFEQAAAQRREAVAALLKG